MRRGLLIGFWILSMTLMPQRCSYAAAPELPAWRADFDQRYERMRAGLAPWQDTATHMQAARAYVAARRVGANTLGQGYLMSRTGVSDGRSGGASLPDAGHGWSPLREAPGSAPAGMDDRRGPDTQGIIR
jgi:hypothetical protein